MQQRPTRHGGKAHRAILNAAGIEVPAEPGLAGELAGTDDVLDAVAASWTAARFSRGEAVSYPETPESFGDCHAAAIWA